MQNIRRVIRVGAVILEEPLYVEEFARDNSHLATKSISAAGTHVVFVKDIITPYITVASGEDSWVDEATMQALKQLWSNSVGVDVEIEAEDNTVLLVRCAYEKESELSFAQIFDCADYFRIKMPLAITNN